MELYTDEPIETGGVKIEAPTLNGAPLDSGKYTYYPSDENGEELSSVVGPCIHTMNIPLVQNHQKQFANASNIYELVYFTKMDSRYVTGWEDSDINEADYQNTATLLWKWPDGSGDGKPPTPPSITKGPGHSHMNKALIQKTYVKGHYDPMERNRHWRVTANPAHIHLESVTLLEDLTAAPADANVKTYEPHSFTREATKLVPGVEEIDAKAAKQAIKESVEKGLENAGIEGAEVKVSFVDVEQNAPKKLEIASPISTAPRRSPLSLTRITIWLRVARCRW